MEKGLNDNNIDSGNDTRDESCDSACINSSDIADLAGVIRDSFGLKKIDMRTYSPLALAFISTFACQRGRFSLTATHVSAKAVPIDTQYYCTSDFCV